MSGPRRCAVCKRQEGALAWLLFTAEPLCAGCLRWLRTAVVAQRAGDEPV